MIIIASNSDTTIISHHVISRHSRSHITSYHILSSCHGNCNHCLHRHHHPPHHIIAIYLSYLLSISIPYRITIISSSNQGLGSAFLIVQHDASCCSFSRKNHEDHWLVDLLPSKFEYLKFSIHRLQRTSIMLIMSMEANSSTY